MLIEICQVGLQALTKKPPNASSRENLIDAAMEALEDIGVWGSLEGSLIYHDCFGFQIISMNCCIC